jgi:N-acetylglucosamine malate deacetylase 1
MLNRVAARRILILAPHPDDEVVACGIATLRAGAAGGQVFVLYLTTGVPEPQALWPWQRAGHRARIVRRRAEAMTAAALLGLEPLGFRDTPSRRLRHDLDGAAAAVAAAIAQNDAGELWVTAFEGGHQDHDAANALAAAWAGRLPIREFAAYHFAGGRIGANSFADPRGGDTRIQATREEADVKRQALRCYRSERGNLRHVGVMHECSRALPVCDYRAPPHQGVLFRERFHWLPIRHPRIDYAPSAEVYRDIGRWAAAHRAALGDAPGGEARQPDRDLAGPLDEGERQRGVGR